MSDEVLTAVTSLARELADPIRLATLQLLAAEGPHSMCQLATVLRVSGPRLGNHLARLREAELVTVEHSGRHAVYRVARSDLGDVLAALTRYAHGDLSFTRSPTRADVAHTCYGHLAGRLGVTVFAHLVRLGGVVAPTGDTDEATLGPNPDAFRPLGIDPAAVEVGRRKLATACLDRSHRLPHLGGALGEAVYRVLLSQKVVRPVPASRELVITSAGHRMLAKMLPEWTE
jgi:DNA-binding transcriptional ArsR family regulator